MGLHKLNLGQKIASASALALLAFMFFDWFEVEVSNSEVNYFALGPFAPSTAWDALDYIPIFLLITIVAVLAVAALRLTGAAYQPPFPTSVAVAVLGGVAVLLILYRIIDPPGGGPYMLPPNAFDGSRPSVDVVPTLGIFLSLIAAAGITYGGSRSMGEEGITIHGGGA